MIVLSTTILLFLVLDPIGNMPPFIAALKNTPEPKRKKVILRELVIALFVLIIFLFFGKYILEVFQISRSSLGIAGGIVLFLIAITMVFPTMGNFFAQDGLDAEPFVVPLAIPLIAGPSSMAILMLLMARNPDKWLYWLVSLILAWLFSGVILMSADKLIKIMGNRVINAFERLTGLILTALAVEMFINGIRSI